MSQFDQSPEVNDPRDQQPYKRQTVRITPARIGWALLAIVTIIFILQNGNDVNFKFFFWRVDDVALWFALLIAIALGALLGWFGHVLYRRRRRKDDD